MSTLHWQRLAVLFDRLIEIEDRHEQARLLAELGRDDPALGRELDDLLQAHAEADGFLNDPVLSETARLLNLEAARAWIGRELGSWRLDRLLHQGGMGSVFLARRVRGGFEQVAALKLIRTELGVAGMAGFAQERQVLARLEHPNISRLLDGGWSDDGIPWLVMEFVDGEPITQWCDRRRLGLSQRLELFEQVCAAVAHAHRQLIVHRDIKPANILVDRSGRPRLLDFGIARLLDAEGSEGNPTLTIQRALTPGYASPEQFLGLPVNTSSDVYSLGMLLYELLVGQTAYQIEGASSPSEIERLICHQLPLPPSQRFANVVEPELAGAAALARASSIDQLRRRLRGDLDWIVMTALRKEPERRYGSVEAFREDLRRFRRGLPVQARPDSFTYRAGRFWRRHWLGVGAIVALLVALTSGLGLAVFQAEQLRQERDRTVRVNQFLQEILLEADPYEAGAEASVRDLLTAAGTRVGERFADAPDLEASVRLTLGRTQVNLMALDAAAANLDRAYDLQLAEYGARDSRTLLTANWRAWLAYQQGDLELAEQRYRATLARLSGSEDWQLQAETFNEFAIILVEGQRQPEAVEIYQQALDLWLRHEPDNLAVALLHNNMAGAWRGLGQTERAIEGYRQSLKALRGHFPDGKNPYLAVNLTNLAVMLQARGDLDEALDKHRQSLDIRHATFGPDNPSTGLGHVHLARVLLDLERPDQARAQVRKALAILQAELDPDHLHVLLARASAGRLALQEGRWAEAIDALDAAVRALESIAAPVRHIDETRLWLEQARAQSRRIDRSGALSPAIQPDS